MLPKYTGRFRFEKRDDGVVEKVLEYEKRIVISAEQIDAEIQEIAAQKIRLDEAVIALEAQKLIVADVAK